MSKAKNTKVENPERVIRDLCRLISLVEGGEFVFPEIVRKPMELTRRIIAERGLDFANEVGRPFNVIFSVRGEIAKASEYEMTPRDIFACNGASFEVASPVITGRL